MRRKYFVTVFVFLFLLGCNKNNNEFIFISNENKVFSTKNFVFYTNNNEEVYLFLENKKERDIISKKTILSVKYRSNDEQMEAKIIDIVFSRELNRSPFIIEVDSKTKTIATIKKNNKDMFYIGQKRDLSPNLLKAVVRNTKDILP
ncbi:MAG TPA: hypothetical protein PLL09_07880 [Flavobacterium sp.]|uniref:hypothetical protein n=1 Tax=unclassified Flavobacterium TaxID=196869 RepID=UPI0025C21229|nr:MULTISPECIES: hypothetical protein [unclassified Flavobacterium]HRE77728.1 hypothetical protein [Flavobacterium sp.]